MSGCGIAFLAVFSYATEARTPDEQTSRATTALQTGLLLTRLRLALDRCTACGLAAPLGGHGLTRLRVWPEGLVRPDRGGVVGPYAPSNLAPAWYAT